MTITVAWPTFAAIVVTLIAGAAAAIWYAKQPPSGGNWWSFDFDGPIAFFGFLIVAATAWAIRGFLI